jgi:hypothetical protein
MGENMNKDIYDIENINNTIQLIPRNQPKNNLFIENYKGDLLPNPKFTTKDKKKEEEQER